MTPTSNPRHKPTGRPVRPDKVLEAAERLAAARVRYAEAFLRYKIRDVTDGQAHQQAILQTGAELTVLEARLFIAEQEARRAAKS